MIEETRSNLKISANVLALAAPFVLATGLTVTGWIHDSRPRTEYEYIKTTTSITGVEEETFYSSKEFQPETIVIYDQWQKCDGKYYRDTAIFDAEDYTEEQKQAFINADQEKLALLLDQDINTGYIDNLSSEELANSKRSVYINEYSKTGVTKA